MSTLTSSTDSGTGATPEGEVGLRMQEGIYFRSTDKRPGHCYRLALVNIKPETSRPEAKEAIAAVWERLQKLRTELVDALPPEKPSQPRLPPDLTCLLGFGAGLFDQYPMIRRPNELVPLGERPFPSLRWVERDRRVGEADLAIQLIAETELAVDQAVVEIWMLITGQSLPLEIVTFHGGFNRDDERNWLGFHDGISNIKRSQRRKAIEVAVKDPHWMEGGTYMAFLRLAVDLEAWRRLPTEHQEILVGRDKIAGHPIGGLDANMMPIAVDGCPVVGKWAPSHVEPPSPSLDVLRASHIHRTHANRPDPNPKSPAPSEVNTVQNNRIFRQGYEFVEPLANGRLRLGLNFVSFQSSLRQITNILLSPGWLGNVNFGGYATRRPGAPAPIELIRVIAGGYYAVPPMGQPFPGAEIFQ